MARGSQTLIRLISTLLLPDSGQINFFGYDVVKDSFKFRQMINRVSVEASFFKRLSSEEKLGAFRSTLWSFGARRSGKGGKDTRSGLALMPLGWMK